MQTQPQGLFWNWSWPAAAGAALLWCGSAGAQLKADMDVRIDESVKKAADFLWTKQKPTTVLLFQKIWSNEGAKVIKIENAKWGDVVIMKGTTNVKVKGQVYTEIECVIPPGWFEPEPPMSEAPKPPPGAVPAKEGYGGNINPWFGGTTCLATQALLTTRLFHPMKDPRMKLAVECVLNMHVLDPGGTGSKTAPAVPAGAQPGADKPPRQLVPGVSATYVLGLHAPALEMAIRRGVTGTLKGEIMRALDEDYRRLAKGTVGDEGWKYLPKLPGWPSNLGGPWRWDLSNTQYGILAAWAAARAGVEMDNKLWEQLNKLIVSEQAKEGGWGYSPTNEAEPSPTMTTAGIASLFVILDNLWTKNRGFNGPDVTPFSNTPMLMKTVQGIDRGLDFFGRIYRPVPDAYFLYGVERIGEASGYKYFGEHDWFREGVEIILSSQTADGEYRLPSRYFGQAVSTALGLLFVVHGRGPILINKLQYGPKGDWQWHNYPRDAANLTRAYDRRYETEANWQVVSLLKDKEEDLMDSPVLYISGYRGLTFADEEVDMLRRYVEKGGTLLMIACGGRTGGKKFLDSAAELARRMYPAEKFPEYRLTGLPRDHPVMAGLDGGASKGGPRGREALRTEIWHIHNGHRSFLFLVPEDINHIWHSNRRATGEEAFNVFANIRGYATDKDMLGSRFRVPVTAGITAAAAKGAIKVGTVKYNSAGKVALQVEPGKPKTEDVPAAGDWASAGSAWPVYKTWFQHVTGYDLNEVRGIALLDPALKSCDVLHMSGHYPVSISPAELDALRAYLQGGGTLLVDAAGGHDMDGRREFHVSVRNLLKELIKGATLENVGLNDPIISGKIGDGTGFDCSEVGFSRHLKLNVGQKSPVLQGIRINGRTAVILSQYDLSCALAGVSFWERDGYSFKSARELAANILLSSKTAKPAAGAGN